MSIMSILRGKKGQNTAEYAILLALVVAAAVAMQTYVKRSLQGGIKYAVDKVKKNDTAQGQYEPYYMASSYETESKAYTDTEETKEGGEVIRVLGSHEKVRSGYQETRATSGAD